MRAVVFGANGQDGSYLVELLAARGLEVEGWGRQAGPRHWREAPGVSYREIDLSDGAAICSGLEQFRPERVFHLAAVHGAHGFAYEAIWGDALAVNTGALHAVLEYARTRAPALRVIYASSAKVFGEPLTGHITADHPRSGRCLYSITKIAGEQLADYYHDRWGLDTRVAFFFNHESPRRPASYFVPSVVRILARALGDRAYVDQVGTLDFYCDWGSAAEYMELLADLAEGPERKALFATGRTWHGREMVERLFEAHGLDWRDHLRVRSEATGAVPFQVDTASIEAATGRRPSIDIIRICDEIFERLHAGDVIHE